MRWRQHEAAVLPATETAVAADQRLEGRDVEGVGVDGAVDVELGALAAMRSACAQHRRRVVAERLQRVDTLDHTGVQVVAAGPADGDRAVCATAR